jgi:hypothetical protein
MGHRREMYFLSLFFFWINVGVRANLIVRTSTNLTGLEVNDHVSL